MLMSVPHLSAAPPSVNRISLAETIALHHPPL